MTHPTDEPTPEDGVPFTAEHRRALIKDLQRDALAEESSLLANLQLNGADLLEMSHVLKEAIAEATASRRSVTELQEVLPFYATYLGLCRQADRTFRLKHDLDRGCSGGAHAARHR